MPRTTWISRRNRIRSVLETLDERIVPAAIVDLTSRGAEHSANGALFRQCDPQPTGTGVIRSFLRIQGRGVERGHNTDARPLCLDENNSPQFTRSITLSQVPVVYVNGTAYREFLLDINQRSSSSLLSLDELRIYVGGAANLNGYDATTTTLAGLSPAYDLDANGDVTVKMDYRLNSGSGAGDVTILIPNSAFSGQPDSAFVYLYSLFGATWGANGGFEEWAVREGTASAPLPSPPPAIELSSLSGYVYFDGDKSYDRTADDTGIAGVEILLQGTDDLGQPVSRTVMSDASGFYKFTDLRPGTYSIIEMYEPAGASPDAYYFVDGVNTVGSLGGTNVEYDWVTSPVTPDAITGIIVGAGVQGVNYNFGEWSEGLIKLR